MTIDKNSILDKTHHGLTIYAYILREYLQTETVLSLSGDICKPVKNPFSQSQNKTLLIQNINSVFMFEDTENKDLKGDPFDFAELHFNVSGDELLKKINEVLYLNLDKSRNFYGFNNSNKNFEPSNEIQTIQQNLKIPEFTYFKKPVSNTVPLKNVNLIDVYKLIKSETFKEATEKLRKFQNKTEARKFKAANFDYVTFSGIFTKRENSSLLKHSGLLTVDFDHVSDLDNLRKDLLKDEYLDTELLFVSPSGDGLKWIISIDLSEFSHIDNFEGVYGYIFTTYNIEIDKSGKDIARACFLAHDKNVFINPKYLNYVCNEKI